MLKLFYHGLFRKQLEPFPSPQNVVTLFAVLKQSGIEFTALLPQHSQPQQYFENATGVVVEASNVGH